MSQHILFIHILRNSVYVEYVNREFEYVSFKEIERIITTQKPYALIFSCMEEADSLAVLHTLLKTYDMVGSQLIRKRDYNTR